MTESSKKLAAQAGAFTGAVLAFFLILAAFVALGRKNWEKGLRIAVGQVLPDSQWQCGRMVPIQSSFGVSAGLFELTSQKEPSKKASALIVRITTHWGPLPAVFVCQDGKAEFAGIAYFNNSAAKEFGAAGPNRQIDYWTGVAREIAERALEEASR